MHYYKRGCEHWWFVHETELLLKLVKGGVFDRISEESSCVKARGWTYGNTQGEYWKYCREYMYLRSWSSTTAWTCSSMQRLFLGCGQSQHLFGCCCKVSCHYLQHNFYHIHSSTTGSHCTYTRSKCVVKEKTIVKSVWTYLLLSHHFCVMFLFFFFVKTKK